MGVSGDSGSIVSGRVVNRKPSTLPLTIDLCFVGGGFLGAPSTHFFVNYIQNSRQEFPTEKLPVCYREAGSLLPSRGAVVAVAMLQ